MLEVMFNCLCGAGVYVGEADDDQDVEVHVDVDVGAVAVIDFGETDDELMIITGFHEATVLPVLACQGKGTTSPNLRPPRNKQTLTHCCAIFLCCLGIET